MFAAYWGALGQRQRTGLVIGVTVLGALLAGAVVWLVRDPMVPLASGLEPSRLAALTQELDRAKVTYRVGESGDGVEVPQSRLGAARAAAGGGYAAAPSVGLELFKDADFSSNDFTQRINYQRALQGELTRTLQGIAGVRGVRVHVVLPEAAVFKRDSKGGSAAVTLAMVPGHVLTAGQVRGIQRLVAASAPQIRIDDVVVLDETGGTISRRTADAEGDMSSSQLDLKRQADQYLQTKLERLLGDVMLSGVASVSVDTVLDYKQMRVTSEEPIAARPATEQDFATGVLLKERQSQRSRPGNGQAGDAGDPESTESEMEFKVGHRTEQILLAPGAIKRISVAVALRGAPANLGRAEVEQLVAHAAGVDRSRGDSVTVLMLPAAAAESARHAEVAVDSGMAEPEATPDPAVLPGQWHAWEVIAALVAVAMVLLAALLAYRAYEGLVSSRRQREIDVDAVAAKVKAWIS